MTQEVCFCSECEWSCSQDRLDAHDDWRFECPSCGAPTNDEPNVDHRDNG